MPRAKPLPFAWLCAALAIALAGAASAEEVYRPITPTQANRTVVLTGHDLTIDQLVQAARYGARVELSPEARQRSADAYGLLLQAPVEGVSVYLFTRAAGPGRETVILEGDPMSPENKAKLEQKELRAFQNGVRSGGGPEVADEDLVRAMMIVRANTMSYDPASPQLTQMLIDLINARITPVVRGLGTTSEGDLATLGNMAAAMVGRGDVYYRGVRMPADRALREAGLQPLKPFAADFETLITTVAYASAGSALLVHDARQALEWADLVYAMDLSGMNSSVTPLSLVVQTHRPLKWLNWHALKTLDVLKGSYLFNGETRIIQDPESLRASSIRQASAWQAWSALRDGVLAEINSGDHNPAVVVGMSPQDAWELDTPQMRKYFIKGGRYSNGKSGYIVSNANWDPYPFTNEVEAFTIALANMDIAVRERIDRFGSTFFTGVTAAQALNLAGLQANQGGAVLPQAQDTMAVSAWQGIANAMVPVTPQGSADATGVSDLAAQTALKNVKAREAVDLTLMLLGQDLLTASLWVDARKAQDPSRQFGPTVTKVWTEFRKVAPLPSDPASQTPVADLAYTFLKTRAASEFYGAAPALPTGDGAIPVPLQYRRGR